MMLRVSLLAGATALALFAAPLASPATAGQRSSPPVGSTAFGLGGKPQGLPSTSGYNVSTALATALAVNGIGNPVTLNTDGIGPGKTGPVLQLKNAPAVQIAVGTAVSLGGDASASARDLNPR
jgi:hypothetical protein